MIPNPFFPVAYVHWWQQLAYALHHLCGGVCRSGHALSVWSKWGL